jgi:hypothetical protein
MRGINPKRYPLTHFGGWRVDISYIANPATVFQIFNWITIKGNSILIRRFSTNQMKVILLASILICLYAQNQTYPPPQCDPTYYGNNGETCDGNTRKCKWFYNCKNNVCTYGNIGAKCQVKEDCFGFKEENLRCVNQVCLKPKYPGYSCRDSNECWTGTCVGGLCTGKKLNDACNPANLAECDYGMYCSLAQKKCVPQIRLLSMCNDYVIQDDIPQGANYNIMCPGGSVCMGQPGAQTCRPYKNGDIGDGCNFDRDGSEACKFGLRCSRARNICVPTTQINRLLLALDQEIAATQRVNHVFAQLELELQECAKLVQNVLNVILSQFKTSTTNVVQTTIVLMKRTLCFHS